MLVFLIFCLPCPEVNNAMASKLHPATRWTRSGLFVVTMTLSLLSVAVAQDVRNTVNIGFPPNGIFEGSNFDSVQMNNGNLHIQSPFLFVPGRGLPTSYNYSYDNKGWAIISTILDNGFQFDRVVPDGLATMTWNLSTPIGYRVLWSAGGDDCPFPPSPLGTTIRSNYLLQDPTGTKHGFIPRTVYTRCGNITITQLRADDGSGGLLNIDPNTGDWASAVSKEGTIITPATVIEDSNGNEISSTWDSVTSTYKNLDTLGRKLIFWGTNQLTGKNALQYVDSNGNPRAIAITTIPVAVQTSLCQFSDVPGRCHEYATTFNQPSEIRLPNNQTYTFTYAQNAYGEPTSVTLPTGAQISWTWGSLDRGGRRVISRTVALNGQSYVWNYSYGDDPFLLPTVWKNTVTDPVGDETDYTCTDIRPSPPSWGYSNAESMCVITKVEFFAGSATTGQLLKTVTTDYANAGTVIPIRETTTWSQQNLVTKTETDWDQLSWQGGPITWRNPTARREYNWGSGAPGGLLRAATYGYLHLTNTDYLNKNIADRRTSEVVYESDGITVHAQTQFEYDNYAAPAGTPLTPSNAIQHDSSFGTTYVTRGNLTAVQRWRSGDGAWLATRNQFDDAGNVLKTTDPLVHATTFDYGDSWGNSACAPTGGNGAAYVTSVTDALSHVSHKTYNSCTGTVASATDVNNQTTTFSYDLLNRYTQTNLPD